MKYKNLLLYKPVFNSPDFSFISDQENINNVLEIIKTWLKNLSDNDKTYKTFLENYFNKLESFYVLINGNKNPYIKEGFLKISETIINCIRLFNNKNRQKISGGSLRNFKNDFIYGLNKFTQGIRTMFYPKVIGNLKNFRDIIINYILDKNVGLGRLYNFKQTGKKSFESQIDKFDINSILSIIRALEEKKFIPFQHSKWIRFGSSRDPFRMYGTNKGFLGSKRTIYYLIHNDAKEKNRMNAFIRTHDPS